MDQLAGSINIAILLTFWFVGCEQLLTDLQAKDMGKLLLTVGKAQK